jgi:hypothetical protein
VRRASAPWLIVTLAICVATLLADSAGAAEGPLFSLDYRKPAALAEACPDDASFRNLVTARLGYDPFAANLDAPNRIRVELNLAHGRVAASATLTREGQAARSARALEGAPSECEAVVAALATTVAIALDPMRASATGAPALPPGSKDDTPRQAEPPLPGPERPHPKPLVLFASAAPVISIGLAPSPSLGGEAGFGMRRGQFSLEALARAETTPTSVQVASGDHLGATVYSGSLLPCGWVVGLRLCGVVRIGLFEGAASDLARPKSGAASFYGALGLRAGYQIRLTEALALEPSLDVAAPLDRTELVINGAGVWTASVVSAGAAVTLHVFF